MICYASKPNKMKYSLFLLLICAFFVACDKDLSLENAQVEKVVRKYQLRAFYSDVPVDFVESDDVIKQETDLWVYVKEYLKDDVNIFSESDSSVVIHQNEIKIPGNEEPLLFKDYYIGTDAEGTFMKFLGPSYEPLVYRLVEMTENYILVYVVWKDDVKIYSRFERVQ